jgi:two-component system sensor histidine kinase MprB
MNISVRLTLVFGALGFVTVAGISTAAYVLAANESRESIDNELVQRVAPFVFRAETGLPDGVPPMLDPPQPVDDAPAGAEADLSDFNTPGDTTRFQLLLDDGTTIGLPDFEPSPEARASLEDSTTPLFESAEIDGVDYRVLTIGLDVEAADDLPGVVGMQLYRDVTNEHEALSNLAARLATLSLVGVGVVALVSWLVGRWLARPIRQLTDVASDLAELDDVPGRVEINRSDEIGQLADSFNKVMAALEIGREQQRRLVADASHELRTPLTSLRMRVEFLADHDTSGLQRTEMLRAAVADAEQLSALVSDLVDLAADVRTTDEEPEEVALGELVVDVVERARTSTSRDIDVAVDDTVASVRPTMIRRAIQNLVDNAVKYSPSDSPIAVSSFRGAVEVVDAGPGIAPEDAAHVFDRFFRSPKARSRPGNGIGLAIVKQVAEAHGGHVWVGDAPGGGARVGFSVRPTSIGNNDEQIFSNASV